MERAARSRDENPPDRLGERQQGLGLTRREVLRAAAAGGVLVGAGLLGSCGSRPVAPAGPTSGEPHPDPLRRDGVVVVVRSDAVMGPQRRVDPHLVSEMVATGIARLAEAPTPREAWLRFYAKSDVVGLKVNCLGAPATHTHLEVALAAASGLQDAGVPASSIIIFDRLTDELARAGFPVNTGEGLRCYGSDVAGYDTEPIVAGEVGSCFSRIVSQQCTSLLNLPLLKDHDLAGVSASLKNHFGCINNPNKLHIGHCNPHAADLNLAPPLRGKQRLIVCDALEVIYDGGPTYSPGTTANYGGLLIGTDPVAVDRVGWRIIEDLRAAAGLRSLADDGRKPAYIETAGEAARGLGVADLSRIQIIEVAVG